MKDKFKDTKGLNKAYMSLAKHYDERKEKAIRQVKDGAFVDLLNQEMEELQNSMKDKEKQIEEIFDILNKFEFFQGQRAGRELWLDKPKEAQDKDIADFVKGINYIRDYLNNSVVLSRELYNEMIDDVKVSKEKLVRIIDSTKAEASKETAEKILNEINRIVNKNAIKVNRDDYECCGFIYMVDCGDVALCLDQLAKQFGVEIKENKNV